VLGKFPAASRASDGFLQLGQLTDAIGLPGSASGMRALNKPNASLYQPSRYQALPAEVGGFETTDLLELDVPFLGWLVLVKEEKLHQPLTQPIPGCEF